MRSDHIKGLTKGVAAASWAALRVLLAALAGLVVILGALMFGVVLSAILIPWALVTRRRPGTAHFGWRGVARRGAFRAGASRWSAGQGDVIDVEVREVATRGTRNS
jgi:hypothetical protein